MSEWKPIHTAPLETPILAWDGKQYAVAEYQGHNKGAVYIDGEPVGHLECYLLLDGTYAMNDWEIHRIYATHWMPLPEPPK